MEEIAATATLKSLPKDMFYMILNYLNEGDISSIAIVSKYFNSLIKHAPWRGFDYLEAHKNTYDFVVKAPSAKGVSYKRAFQIPGKRVILLRSDNNIDLWSCGNKKPKQLCKLVDISSKMSAFTYHREKLIIGCENGMLFVFNLPIQKGIKLIKVEPVHSLEHHKKNSVTAITPIDKTQIASGDNNGNILCWDIDTGKLKTSYLIKDEPIITIRAEKEAINVVVTERKNGYQQLCLIENKFEPTVLHSKWPHGQSDPRHRAVLHPSGRLNVFRLEFDEYGFKKDSLCVTSCTYREEFNSKVKRPQKTTHNTFYWDLNDEKWRSNYYAGVSPFQGRVTFFYPEKDTVRMVFLDRIPFEHNRAISQSKL